MGGNAARLVFRNLVTLPGLPGRNGHGFAADVAGGWQAMLRAAVSHSLLRSGSKIACMAGWLGAQLSLQPGGRVRSVSTSNNVASVDLASAHLRVAFPARPNRVDCPRRHHGRPCSQLCQGAVSLPVQIDVNATDVFSTASHADCRDTIAALSSGPGRSGVAVIRLSGPGAGKGVVCHCHCVLTHAQRACMAP